MKKLIIPAALLLGTVLVSCANTQDKTASDINQASSTAADITDNQNDLKGTFSFDGKEVSAPTETQYFGDKEKGNFSVLCQHNESDEPTNSNFELLQVTFSNEKDATSNAALKINDGAMLPMSDPQTGLVAVALSGLGNNLGSKQFVGTDKSTGTITVKNRVIEIKSLVLYNADGEKRIVNASLPF
ncbi:MAG: hypothetical protein JSU03_02755 [Bacteroidetes bacterium]|nr:hypothetical protein [Bacteroidota bacterium]MBS1756179.1 hypothetical protein [Bacteroidota bacterium]